MVQALFDVDQSLLSALLGRRKRDVHRCVEVDVHPAQCIDQRHESGHVDQHVIVDLEVQ